MYDLVARMGLLYADRQLGVSYPEGSMAMLAPGRAVATGPERAEKKGVVHVALMNGTTGKIWKFSIVATSAAERSDRLLAPGDTKDLSHNLHQACSVLISIDTRYVVQCNDAIVSVHVDMVVT